MRAREPLDAQLDSPRSIDRTSAPAPRSATQQTPAPSAARSVGSRNTPAALHVAIRVVAHVEDRAAAIGEPASAPGDRPRSPPGGRPPPPIVSTPRTPIRARSSSPLERVAVGERDPGAARVADRDIFGEDVAVFPMCPAPAASRRRRAARRRGSRRRRRRRAARAARAPARRQVAPVIGIARTSPDPSVARTSSAPDGSGAAAKTRCPPGRRSGRRSSGRPRSALESARPSGVSSARPQPHGSAHQGRAGPGRADTGALNPEASPNRYSTR